MRGAATDFGTPISPSGGRPEPFVAPFADAIDRPPQISVRALSRTAGLRCHTRMTAGTTLTNGTTAEHELAAGQREHGRPLFAFLLRLCDGDRQRAEDLM